MLILHVHSRWVSCDTLYYSDAVRRQAALPALSLSLRLLLFTQRPKPILIIYHSASSFLRSVN